MEYAHYDAVVVLGGGLRKEGEEYHPATFRERDEFGMLGGHLRVAAAAELYRAGVASCFMFTTGVYEKNKARLGDDVPAESVVYAACFQEMIDGRVPPQIVLDTVSTTTLTNMREVFSAVRARGWHTVAVVSNEYHIPRVRALYERMLSENPDMVVDITYLAAEAILKQLRPGGYDAEIEGAYQSDAGRERIESEAQGVRHLDESRYATEEFQLRHDVS